jgi:hypothetical protein
MPTAPSTATIAKPPRPLRKWAVRLAPYVITGAVLTFLLREYPLDRIVAELVHGQWQWLIPLSLAGVFLSLIAVSAADSLVVRAVCGNARSWDLLRAKAASSLLDIIGYAAGHGAYGVWFARFTGARAGLAGGALLYIMAGDLLSVCLVATISVWGFGLEDVGATVRWLPVGIAALLAFFLFIGPYEKLQTDPPLQVFRPWAIVHRRIGFGQILIRMTQMVMWVTVTWVAMRAFGIPVPWTACLAYVPLVMLVGSLPINVGGLGAVQGVWLLFTPWAKGEQILAFAFLWFMMNAGAVTLRGLPFVKRFVAEVAAARASALDDAYVGVEHVSVVAVDEDVAQA